MKVSRNDGGSELRVLRRGGGRPGGAVVAKSTGGGWCKDFCTILVDFEI